MHNKGIFNIAVLPGDGIGREIMAACLEVMKKIEMKIGGFSLSFEHLPAGAEYYLET